MVTEQERLEFLKRQGWREDMSQEDKDRLEAEFTDKDIELALALGY